MIKATKQLAADCAFSARYDFTWDQMRDHCDRESAGDLDCFQLDMLTDWAMEALKGMKIVRSA